MKILSIFGWILTIAIFIQRAKNGCCFVEGYGICFDTEKKCENAGLEFLEDYECVSKPSFNDMEFECLPSKKLI